MKEVFSMPKKADPTKKTVNGTFKSRISASAKYDAEKVDRMVLRVPSGMQEEIQKFVEEIDSREETKDKYLVRGRHSVNAWIVDLITSALEQS